MKTILVTAIGSYAAEVAIRAARELGLRVVGCDVYPASWVVNSADVDAFYQVPYASDPAYRERIRAICEKEQVAALIPSTDDEIDVLNAWRAEPWLSDVALCLSAPDAIRICRDKMALATFAKERQLCRTIPSVGLLEWETIAEDARFAYPLVIKPVDGRSSLDLFIVHNKDNFGGAVSSIPPVKWPFFIVQPFMEGSVVVADVFHAPEQGQTGAVLRRELLRTKSGAGTTVEIFRDPALERASCQLAEALDTRGTVCFEFIENTQDGEYYLLECNPRLSGGVEFSRMAGVDVVANHLLHFLGRELRPLGQPVPRVIARRYQAFVMEERE